MRLCGCISNFYTLVGTSRIELSQNKTKEAVEGLRGDMAELKDGGARLLNRMQSFLDDGEKNRETYLEILERQQSE